jgi:hypothetical protein
MPVIRLLGRDELFMVKQILKRNLRHACSTRHGGAPNMHKWLTRFEALR